MSIKSHIQIPISVIESFSHKELVTSKDGKINKAGFVYVLYLNQTEPVAERTNEYGSEEGRFDDETESLLCEKYETPFGNTRKKLIDFAMHKVENVTITPEDYANVKNYLKMLLYRNDYFFKLYMKESVVGSVLKTTPSSYIKICDEIDVKPIPRFSEYSFTLVVATGKRGFINNFCGFSYLNGYRDTGYKLSYFIPLSPKCGVLLFVPKSTNKEDVYKDHLWANDEDVLEVNKQIATTETIFTKHSIISKNKAEILEMAKHFKQ